MALRVNGKELKKEAYKEIKDIMKLMAQEGSIAILHKTDQGWTKYKEMQKILTNPPTLSRRLDKMVELGLIEKKILNEKYRPTVYKSTEAGRRVFWDIVEMQAEIITLKQRAKKAEVKKPPAPTGLR